jgi:hypothetical protein
MKDVRDFALAMVDEGHADANHMLLACLKYMSTDDVRDMLHCNEYPTCEEDLAEGISEEEGMYCTPYDPETDTEPTETRTEYCNRMGFDM